MVVMVVEEDKVPRFLMVTGVVFLCRCCFIIYVLMVNAMVAIIIMGVVDVVLWQLALGCFFVMAVGDYCHRVFLFAFTVRVCVSRFRGVMTEVNNNKNNNGKYFC